MKKVDALRALLLSIVPGLKDKPDNLSMFIAKGRLGAIASASLSFEYRFTLTIVVQDYAGDVDAIFVPMLAWISQNQPELLRKQDVEPFSFEIDILDADASDIEIQIELTEAVVVKRVGASWTVVHKADKPITDMFGDVPEGVRLSALLIEDLTAGQTIQIPEPVDSE